MLLSVAFLFLLTGALASEVLSSQPAESSGSSPDNNPLPDCEICLTRAQVEAPGVGIDLTTTYGTAVVRYHNGSVIGITKVDASPEYISMMRRFTYNPVPCTSPKSPVERTLCDIARDRRRVKKLLGLPSTPDVATLSNLLTSVASAASADHNISITSVYLTLPYLQGYDREDVADALYYANLTGSVRGSDSYEYTRFAYESPAAFAASGGMCKNWTMVWECTLEERDRMEYREVMTVGYTMQTLSVTMEPMRNAFSGQYRQGIMDWEFGKGSKANFPSEKFYWDEIKKKIQLFPRASGWPVKTLLVIGEEGKDETFLRVLQEALEEVQGKEEVRILLEDAASLEGAFEPLYLSAKGMALIAKRRQETQPWCEESELCRKHRLPSAIADQAALGEL